MKILQDLSFDQLKARMESVVEKLNLLVVRVTEKTDLAVFLTEICSNFKFEVKNNWSNLDEITVDDELEALTESEQGQLCRATYLRASKRGLGLDLHLIMVG